MNLCLSYPGYSITEKISHNEEISIYRVKRLEDRKVLLAKVMNTRFIDYENTKKYFQYEFEHFLTLQGKGVIEPIHLEIVGERLILLFQNIEGFTLQQFLSTMNKGLSLHDKITLSIALVDCVHQLHEANYVINEMLPIYFIVSEGLTNIQIADLRFAQANNEDINYSISNRNVESLFMYTAPEKITEAKNYQLDVYSDCYALGVILYELFAENPPFTAVDLSSLLYQHITTIQQPIYLINPAIPSIVSGIVDKCMGKTPTTRYSSMASLKADLEECRRQLQVTGDIQPFSLARMKSGLSNWRDTTTLKTDELKQLPNDTIVNKVDNPTSDLLSKAAFLGSTFNLQVLAEITGYTIHQLQTILKIAINYQLIYKISNERELYAFQNEEIRQLFKLRIVEKDIPLLHLEAGTVLAKYIGEDIEIPDVLQHFHEVKEQVMINGKKVEVIELYYEAAKNEVRQNKAISYLDSAIDLLQEENWQQHYDLTYRIYKLRIERATLDEQYETVKQLCDILIEKSHRDLDKVHAYILSLKLELNHDHYDNVLELGQKALQLLQLPIELEVGKLKEWQLWWRISRKLGKLPSKKIVNLPQMKDERSKLATQILVYIANACSLSSRAGWLSAVIKLIDLTYKHGVTDESAYGFAGYALVQCNISFQYESAYHYSKLAIDLVKGNLEMTMLVNTIITLCQDSWRKYEPNFLLSITDYTNQFGVLSNNKGQTNYSFLVNCGLLFNFSYPLRDLYVHLLSRSLIFKQDDNVVLWKYATIMSLLLTKLTGNKAEHDPFDYEEIEKSIDEEAINLQEIFSWYKYITSYIFGYYEEAYEAVVKSMKIDENHVQKRLPNISDDYFYVLIVKELFNSGTAEEQVKYMKQIRISLKRLRRMAKRCPENYLHKYLASEAECSKILLYSEEKIESLSEQAIAAAQRYEHLHDVAIISESFAKYSIQIGNVMQAKVYMNEAYTAYQKWGASAKVAQLEEAYGDLLLINKRTALEKDDYLTIVSSAQALSDEIEIEQLVYKLLRIMLQNAGAEYGVLIFDNDGEWFIEVYGSTEKLIVETIPLDKASDFVPKAIIDYTIRMKEAVVLQDATKSGFGRNPYIQQHDLKSVLCLPIMYQNKLLSVLYMENNHLNGVFTEERLDVLKLLCSQCAISITNARLYSDVQYLSKTLDQQVEERTESLQKSVDMTLQALTEMNIYAERNRIAQEIHDIVGHTLTSTVLQIEAGRRLLTKDTDSAFNRLKDAQDLVRHSLNEIRNSVHMLKEDKYYDVGQALFTLIEETESNTGVHIQTSIDNVNYLPVIMKKLIYHALQEGLTNGIRHGHSNEFHFTLKDNGKEVTFTLKDNGIGKKDLKMGFGLSMMRDRVEQLKGTLYIETEHKKGCSLQITLPYEQLDR